MATNDMTDDKDTATDGSAAAATTAPEVMDQVVQMAHDTIDSLAEKAAPQVQRLQEGVEQTGQYVQDKADTLRDLSGEWSQTLRTTVRENPLTAIAAAAAVGMLLAVLLRSD